MLVKSLSFLNAIVYYRQLLGNNGVLTSDENHLLMCLAIVCDTVLVFDTWT